jgi:hypothetical protein
MAPCIGAKVVEMARKLKSKWLSNDQIEAVKGFGRRFKVTMRSGVICNRVWETEDADYGYTYSPSYLIKDIEYIADDMAEKGMEVYISTSETGVEVAGLYPRTWDGEFVSWKLETEEE